MFSNDYISQELGGFNLIFISINALSFIIGYLGKLYNNSFAKSA